MKVINFPIKKNIRLLALGAESAGVFSIYKNGKIFISQNFGDLLDEEKFLRYKKTLLNYLKKEKIRPDVIITDLHPLYNSTILGEELAKKYKIPRVKIQHHLAHIFSAIGDHFCHPEFISGSENYRFRNKFGMTNNREIPNTFFGIAADGTGYGSDGNIWGGEIIKIKNKKLVLSEVEGLKIKNDVMRHPEVCLLADQRIPWNIQRVGSLEEQTMIGGDLAVKEPARMLIAILAKISARGGSATGGKNHKNYIYSFVKRYYTRNEFELLYNQLEQNFNCQKTTSTGRILDAVSLLLGFSGNERKYKHEAVKLLEKNSTIPYDDLGARIMNYESRKIVNTTYLFEYLVKNIRKDKKRLAATAQEYIAKGLYEIIKKTLNTKYQILNTYFAGGMANNKIISGYLEKKGVYLSKKIPRGDEGIAFGQIVYYLFNND